MISPESCICAGGPPPEGVTHSIACIANHNLCGHTEHALRGGQVVGRHFNGPDPAGYWESCKASRDSAE